MHKRTYQRLCQRLEELEQPLLNTLTGGAIPNGDGSNLKFMGIFNLGHIDRKQWNIEVARHLRFLAAHIETNGLNEPHAGYIEGRIENGSLEPGHVRSILEYNQR